MLIRSTKRSDSQCHPPSRLSNALLSFAIMPGNYSVLLAAFSLTSSYPLLYQNLTRIIPRACLTTKPTVSNINRTKAIRTQPTTAPQTLLTPVLLHGKFLRSCLTHFQQKLKIAILLSLRSLGLNSTKQI